MSSFDDVTCFREHQGSWNSELKPRPETLVPFFLSWKLGWWCLWELLLTWLIPLWTQTSDYAYQINFHLVQEFLKGFIDSGLIKITKKNE